MGERTKLALAKATRKLLVPIARLFLRSGLTFDDFKEASKRAFVAAAIHETRKDGEKVTVSKIATLTGFTNADAKRLKESLEDMAPASHEKIARPQRVLDGAYAAPGYQDESGKPLILAYRGATRSFAALVKLCAGTNQRAKPILTELEKAGAARELQDGRVQFLKRSCANAPADPASIARCLDDVSLHAGATLENLLDEELEPHFVRVAHVANLQAEHARILMNRFAESAQVATEGVGRSLSNALYQAKPGEDGVSIHFSVQLLKVSPGGKLLRRGEGRTIKRKKKELRTGDDPAQRGGRS